MSKKEVNLFKGCSHSGFQGILISYTQLYRFLMRLSEMVLTTSHQSKLRHRLSFAVEFIYDFELL